LGMKKDDKGGGCYLEVCQQGGGVRSGHLTSRPDAK
jgi:hypothetical protein